MFPFLSAWFTFPWSYEDWYSENDTADKRSGCRENVALHNAVMMIVMEKSVLNVYLATIIVYSYLRVDSCLVSSKKKTVIVETRGRFYLMIQ